LLTEAMFSRVELVLDSDAGFWEGKRSGIAHCAELFLTGK